MEDPTYEPELTAPSALHTGRGRSRAGIALAAVAVAAAAFGVTSIASAATNTAASTPKPAATAPGNTAPGNAAQGDADGDHMGGPMGMGGGIGGRGGHGGMGGLMGGPGMGELGMGGALHGEFVVQKADGTYQTVDMQGGAVTAVSTSAITVKSVDGFTKSYEVTASTIVNAARDGIASVKVGDTVHLGATVTGDKATAVGVLDETTLKASGMQWHHERLAPSATPSASASTS